MNLKWPKGLDSQKFLKQYWQKKPLLIRKAFTKLPDIEASEIAGLACEDDIESRVISENSMTNDWHIQHGAFDEHFFSSLPDSHWTLLVQDVDKFVPEAKQLVNVFNFIPSWRVDDLMVSYAVDQGSVGPHTDSYDVFLVQLQGKRLWKISDATYTDDDLLADSDVRVLKEFSVSEEWVLEPGDMLYLPPNVAHFGIAQGECMTGSIGFISPTQNDMFQSWATELTQYNCKNSNYQDPEISLQNSPAEILPSVIEKVREMLLQNIDTSSATLASWFGKMITEPKDNLYIQSEDECLIDDDILELIQKTPLSRHPFLKPVYFCNEDNTVSLFVQGEEFVVANENRNFIEYLCQQNSYEANELSVFLNNSQCHELITEFIRRNFIMTG